MLLLAPVCTLFTVLFCCPVLQSLFLEHLQVRRKNGLQYHEARLFQQDCETVRPFFPERYPRFKRIKGFHFFSSLFFLGYIVYNVDNVYNTYLTYFIFSTNLAGGLNTYI